jgi:hypothetical protein
MASRQRPSPTNWTQIFQDCAAEPIAEGVPAAPKQDDKLFINMDASQLVEEARWLACRFGGGPFIDDEAGRVVPCEASEIVAREVQGISSGTFLTPRSSEPK